MSYVLVYIYWVVNLDDRRLANAHFASILSFLYFEGLGCFMERGLQVYLLLEFGGWIYFVIGKM